MIIRWIQTYALFIVSGIAAFFAIAFGVQTIRLEGLKIWPFEIEGCKAANQRLIEVVEDMEQASVEAQRQAEANLAAEELRHKENKEFADARIIELEQENASRLSDFIAANPAVRLRPPPSRSVPGTTITSSGDSDTGSNLQTNPADLMDGPELVAVPASDLLTCQTYFNRLLSIQEWGAGVNQPIEP